MDAADNLSKKMNLFKAFFDESGIHNGALITGVSGFIGPSDVWSQLEAKWNVELKRFRDDTGHDITAFHSTECGTGEGPWFGIPSVVREAYNLKLAKVICEFEGLQGISVSIVRDDWEKIVTDEFKKRYISPYQLCAEHCFQQVSSYARALSANAQVALIFAEHDKFSDEVEQIFKVYMGCKAWRNMTSLTFASPRTCVPLQTADMISNETYRSWVEAEKHGLKGFRDRPPLRVLEQSGHLKFAACYAGQGLKNAVGRFQAGRDLPRRCRVAVSGDSKL